VHTAYFLSGKWGNFLKKGAMDLPLFVIAHRARGLTNPKTPFSGRFSPLGGRKISPLRVKISPQKGQKPHVA
jgi:hypothetical protein